MIFKTIEGDLGKTKFGINDSFKGLFNGSFFKGEKLLSDNDIRALQAYNAEIERGVSPVTAYYRTMQDASDAAVNMAQSAGEGTVQINNMTKSSKAAEIGLKALSIAGNMLAMWAISQIPTLIHKLSNWMVDSKTNADELEKEIKSLSEEYDKNESRLDKINSSLQENETRIKELNSLDKLSYVEQSELTKLIQILIIHYHLIMKYLN